MSPTHLILPTLVAAALVALTPQQTRAADPLTITSKVTYDVKPDSGPVRVAWDVKFVNNDPDTQSECCGTIFFYDELTIPVLRGAKNLSARTGGDALAVSVSDPQGPLAIATVEFGQRIFYKETFDFSLSYELPSAREQSLLVTPSYVFIPAITLGDESTVTVNAPFGGTWEVDLEAAECEQKANVFSCSGSDALYLAALAEVSRPDALTDTSFDVAVKEKSVPVKLSYFKGEGATATHLKELVTKALPIIEELAGFKYPSKARLDISQSGRQAILGYEGLTTCDLSSCDIMISPVSDDETVLHELAHLWSEIYGKRWLSEGMAQIIAEETAARLPAGLVKGEPPQHAPSDVLLQLDEWGGVDTVIGASKDKLAVETAGYDRSLRFFYILRHDLGLDALKKANAEIARRGSPMDSERYLDRLEEASGKRLDDLFLEWVFAPTMAPVLKERREARDRLASVTDRAIKGGLSDEIPGDIQVLVDAWDFESAFTALDEAENNLREFDRLKAQLDSLTSEAQSVGLDLPSAILETMKRWNLSSATEQLSGARDALDAYSEARKQVDAPRTIWQRFGLIGKNPVGDLDTAATSFATGDFEGAAESADRAKDAVEGASGAAFRRMLVVGAAFGIFAAGIGVAFWISLRRERERLEL